MLDRAWAPSQNSRAPHARIAALTEATRQRYQPELDGIRGLAILAVLLTHCAVSIPMAGRTRAVKYLMAIITPGWAGVDLFFVLSGFLITGILLRTKVAPNYFHSFYARRFLRIFLIY